MSADPNCSRIINRHPLEASSRTPRNLYAIRVRGGCGKLKSKSVVYRYVHNLAACHRIKSGQEHDRADEIAKQCTAIVPSAYPSDAYSINVVRYEGDATNQEAVDKQKIHMALIDRAFLDATSIADGMGTDAFDTYISEHALRTRSLCDIQEVNKGTT